MEERRMVRTKQELVNLLMQKNGLSRKQNMNFVNILVDLINTTLKDEKQLKISGLGTFKVIDTKDRESVNVQTGTRFVIEGRNKITFTPDNAMKELVNRPFSQFETVILNDGVDFKDIPETFEGEMLETESQEPVVDTPPIASMLSAEVPAEEEAPIEKEVSVVEEVPVVEEETPKEEVPAVEETPMEVIPAEEDAPVEEILETVEQVSSEQVSSEEGLMDEVSTEESAEEPMEEEPMEEESAEEEPSVEEPSEDESSEESTDEDIEDSEDLDDNDNDNNEILEETEMEENKSNTGKWLVALLLCTVAGFAGGFFVGKKYAPAKFIPMEKTEMIQGELVDSAAMDSISESDSIQKAKDAKIKAKVDSITRAHEARNESIRLARQNKVGEASAKTEAAPAAKSGAPQQTAQPAKPEAKPVALPKGDNSQALNSAKQMVSTGAYTIVGTQETITVKAGQNMKKISKFYLGDGMECYIQAYNGVSEVTEGMRLKIPKLQVKKKK